MHLSYQMEGVATAHHNQVSLFHSLHLVIEMVYRSEVLEAEFLEEHLLHTGFVGVIAGWIGLSGDVDARKRNKDDAAVLIEVVLQAEEFDLVACPGEVGLAEIGRIAD